MTIESANSSSVSLWAWIAEWWLAKTRRHEVDSLDPAVAADISRDLGTNVGELSALAGKWPDSSPELLTRRLRALDLDPVELSRTQPGAARDLAVRCSLCTAQTRCRHDLDRNPDGPAWREYCVNEVTLTALKDEHDAQAKNEKS